MSASGSHSNTSHAISPRRQGSPPRRQPSSPRKDQLSEEQLREKLQSLEKHKQDEEKGRKKEEAQRRKEIAAVKKSLTREIQATKGNVRKRNMEVGKLRQQLAKIEAKQFDSAQKKTQTASRLDEALHKADQQHNQLEVELQAKLGEMGEARSTLSYLEYAQEVLDKGGVMLGGEPGLEHLKALTEGQHTNGEIHAMASHLEDMEEQRLAIQNDSGATRAECLEEIELLRNELQQLREENEGLRGQLDRERSTVRVQDERVETLRTKLHIFTATMRQKVARIEELTESGAEVHPEMQIAMEDLAKQVSMTALDTSPHVSSHMEDIPRRASAVRSEASAVRSSSADQQSHERLLLASVNSRGSMEESPEEAVGHILPSGFSAGSTNSLQETSPMPQVQPAALDDPYEAPEMASPSPPVPRLTFPYANTVATAAVANGGVAPGAAAAAALAATAVPAWNAPRPLTPRVGGSASAAPGIANVGTSSSSTVKRMETPVPLAGHVYGSFSTPRRVASTGRPLSTPRVRPAGSSGNVAASADVRTHAPSPLPHGFAYAHERQMSPMRPAPLSGTAVLGCSTPPAVVPVAQALPSPPYAMPTQVMQWGVPLSVPQAQQQISGISTDSSPRHRGPPMLVASSPSNAAAEYVAMRRPAHGVSAAPMTAATAVPAAAVVAPPMMKPPVITGISSVGPRALSAGRSVPVASRPSAPPARPQRHVSSPLRGSNDTVFPGDMRCCSGKPSGSGSTVSGSSVAAPVVCEAVVSPRQVRSVSAQSSARVRGSLTGSFSAAPGGLKRPLSGSISATVGTRPVLVSDVPPPHIDGIRTDGGVRSGFADAVHKVTAKALREYRQNHRQSLELDGPIFDGT